MIDPLGHTLTSAVAAAPKASAVKTNDFDAALQAAQKAKDRRQAHASEIEAIKTGGFTNWVRDTQIEALKEKLRKQVMADMGVDDDSLSRLSAVMREVLEKKIKDEVERRMQEVAAETAPGSDDKTAAVQSSVTASQSELAGKKDQDGKTCPVIPALSWPGAASLL